MATLTSAGAVNLTSNTNWSPAQIPVAGDDLIIGAHTLTLNADMTLGSITFNSGGNGRLVCSGTTRIVGATNGFTINSSFSGVSLISNVTAGQNLTLRGTWRGTSTFLNAICSSTGGNVTLATIGDNPASALIEGFTSGVVGITGSWTAGTLNTIGRFDLATYIATGTLVTMSGGTWNHTNTGTSLLGAGGHTVFSGSGTSGINWSGNLTSTSVNAEALFVDNGSTASSFSGTIKRTGNSPTTSFFAGNISPVLRSGGAKTTTITGALCVGSGSRCPSIVTHGATSANRINWRSQTVTIPSTDAVVLLNGASSVMDVTALQISNAGRFVYLEQGAAQAVVDSSTLITNTTTSAQACVVSNSGALDGKVINLASDAPTLPTVSQVAGGTVYGYTASPLTGTGVISDPAVIAAAVSTALNAYDTNGVASRDDLADVGVDLTPVLDKLPVSGRAATAGDAMTLTSGERTASGTAFWNLLTTEAWATNSFGELVLIGSTSQRSVLVTGSHHAAADVHDCQPDGLTSSADAAAIKAKTDNLPSDPADQSIIVAATDAILAAVNTRLATSAYTSPPSVSSIADAVWDEARTGHTTSGTFGFYVDAQISGISGGGGGDATLAKQEEILEAIDTYFTQVIASVNGTQDTIVGFPTSLTIGDSYTEDGGNAIHVFIRDENDDPITSVGGHDFTDADFECDLTITNSGNTGRVRATVTYVDPGLAESYLKVEIPLSESRRAAQGSATMQCVLKWDGVAKTIATQTMTWVARI